MTNTMPQDIQESDWTAFRVVHAELRETFCEQVLDECRSVASPSEASAHSRYTQLFRLLNDKDREMARGFDDIRRSTALARLRELRRMGRLTDEHLTRCSAETREFVRALKDLR